MNKQIAEHLANKLIQKHGAVGYKFSFMARRKKFNLAGQCNWKKKTIRLQPVFVELNTYEIVRNTILHEIAHALKPKHGHNKFWRAKAHEIGCTGLRCYDNEVIKKLL